LENTGRFFAHFTDMNSSLAEVSYTFSELDGYRAMWYSEDALSGSLLVTSIFSSTETEKMRSESKALATTNPPHVTLNHQNRNSGRCNY